MEDNPLRVKSMTLALNGDKEGVIIFDEAGRTTPVGFAMGKWKTQYDFVTRGMFTMQGRAPVSTGVAGANQPDSCGRRPILRTQLLKT